MAEEETTEEAKARALDQVRRAHRKYTEAQDSAKEWHTIRNGTVHTAYRAGVTQLELAEVLGVSQAAISKILSRPLDVEVGDVPEP